MYFTVLILDTQEVYRCRESQTLLLGMEALGKRGIPVGCRGGGCGVCKVEIVDGQYSKRPMSRDHISEDDESGGRVLACRVKPLSDISLRVLGKMRCAVVRGSEVIDQSEGETTCQ